MVPRRRRAGSHALSRLAPGRQAPGSPRPPAPPPPPCAQAWREGAIGTDQAEAIASARRHRTESSMARDEAMLVAQATEMGFDDFNRALDYWKQLADPDGAEASDEERKASATSSSIELLGNVAGPDHP